MKKFETIISEIQGEVNVKTEVDEFDVEINRDSIMDIFKHYDVQLSDYQKRRIGDDLSELVEEQMKEEQQRTIDDISERVDKIEDEE